jgi:precorrin isomerase
VLLLLCLLPEILLLLLLMTMCSNDRLPAIIIRKQKHGLRSETNSLKEQQQHKRDSCRQTQFVVKDGIDKRERDASDMTEYFPFVRKKESAGCEQHKHMTETSDNNDDDDDWKGHSLFVIGAAPRLVTYSCLIIAVIVRPYPHSVTVTMCL